MKLKGNFVNLAIGGMGVVIAAVLFGIGFELGRMGAERGVEHIEKHGLIPKEYNARTVFVSQ